jgi:methionine-rich copper-binding protein CopC
MHSTRNAGLVALVLGTLTAAPHPVRAHAFLDHAEPRVGSTIHGSPPSLILTFTEPIEAKFCRITLTGSDGHTIDAGALSSPAPQVLRLVVPALAPGDYTVHWAVTSVDTHQTEGKYDFTVAVP